MILRQDVSLKVGSLNPQPFLVTSMNFRLLSTFVASGCMFLAACSPYNENQGRRPTQKVVSKSLSTPEQQKLQAQRDAMKQQEALQKKEVIPGTPSEKVGSTTTPSTGIETPKLPVEQKREEYKSANKVPGKEGFVFSPYNNKVVDVRDIPSGTLVQDPTYTGAGKGYFRVP